MKNIGLSGLWFKCKMSSKELHLSTDDHQLMMFGKVKKPLRIRAFRNTWITGCWGFIVLPNFPITLCFLRMGTVWITKLLILLPCLPWQLSCVPTLMNYIPLELEVKIHLLFPYGAVGRIVLYSLLNISFDASVNVYGTFWLLLPTNQPQILYYSLLYKLLSVFHCFCFVLTSCLGDHGFGHPWEPHKTGYSVYYLQNCRQFLPLLCNVISYPVIPSWAVNWLLTIPVINRSTAGNHSYDDIMIIFCARFRRNSLSSSSYFLSSLSILFPGPCGDGINVLFWMTTQPLLVLSTLSSLCLGVFYPSVTHCKKKFLWLRPRIMCNWTINTDIKSQLENTII